MKLRIGHFVAWALMLAFTSTPSRAFDFGDSAPPLQVAEWIKGPPVNFEAGRGSNIFVVDFWTIYSAAYHYSVPYLSNLQKKYKDRGVVLVGISAEPAAKVKNEVARMDPPVAYAIGIDAGRKTF